MEKAEIKNKPSFKDFLEKAKNALEDFRKETIYGERSKSLLDDLNQTTEKLGKGCTSAKIAKNVKSYSFKENTLYFIYGWSNIYFVVQGINLIRQSHFSPVGNVAVAGLVAAPTLIYSCLILKDNSVYQANVEDGRKEMNKERIKNGLEPLYERDESLMYQRYQAIKGLKKAPRRYRAK